jgi:chromosome segregation ATPase
MRREIADMDVTRRLYANRIFSLVMSSLALIGWGALTYSAASSARVERGLRVELAQVKTSEDQLLSERKQVQESVGDLTQVHAEITSARHELDGLARAREQAIAQAAAARQDLAAVTKRLENRAKASETSRVRAAERTSKPARDTTPTKSKT